MNLKTLIVAGSIFILGCQSSQNRKEAIAVDISSAPLIPKPVSITPAQGAFELNEKTTIYVDKSSTGLETLTGYLAQKLFPATGIKLNIAAEKGENQIALLLSENDGDLKDEGYDLDIKPTGVTISANKPAGIFNGIQTLLQLLPNEIAQISKQDVAWVVGAGNIHDFPSYGYRGAMLDVARHFFSVDDVKHYIDLISSYKMNALHLHLSDDQGWRIEIKSWPNLAKHGGSTQVGGGAGGFYTQDQYSEIVKYAQDRFVTIIPEIDMPGHTNAALSSYAVLNCKDTTPPLYTKTEVGFSTLCVRKDSVYEFVDDVVRELAAITPGPYIHLGGDESHVTTKEDFIYFLNKIQPIPKKYGKKMIGWEEVAQAKLDSNTIVQYWSNVEHAKEAVKKGAKIIMSPANRTYLDMKYDSTTKLGLSWAGLIEVDTAYIWSLSDMVKEITNDKIVGVEAPLWTETISTMNDIEYMVFPRLPGIAEIGWTPDDKRSWDEYKLRLAKHGARMRAMDIDFYESSKVPWGVK
jgi:hexosaminidase